MLRNCSHGNCIFCMFHTYVQVPINVSMRVYMYSAEKCLCCHANYNRGILLLVFGFWLKLNHSGQRQKQRCLCIAPTGKTIFKKLVIKPLKVWLSAIYTSLWLVCHANTQAIASWDITQFKLPDILPDAAICKTSVATWETDQSVAQNGWKRQR